MSGSSPTKGFFDISLPPRTVAGPARKILFDYDIYGLQLNLLFSFAFTVPSLDIRPEALENGTDVNCGTVDGDYEDDYLQVQRSSRVRVDQKLRRPSLRSVLSDFLYTFLYQSIPVAVLRSPLHENAVIAISVSLDTSAKCAHYGQAVDDGVCDTVA